MPWAAAIALGAVVAPTDPVAERAARIGIPKRVRAILEGEGLVNDAVAPTIKSVAVGVLLGHTVSASGAVGRFAAIAIGETAFGLGVGWLAARLRARITDSATEVVVTFITPFVAYLIPEALGGSGVLATVAAGMYIGEQMPELVPAGTRLHLTSVWRIIVYGLNGTLFLLDRPPVSRNLGAVPGRA